MHSKDKQCSFIKKTVSKQMQLWDNKAASFLGCAFFKLFQTANKQNSKQNVITVVCLNYAAPPLKIAYIGSSWWNQAGLSFGLPTTSVKTLIQPWCTFSNVSFLPQETDDLTLRTCPTWLVFDWSCALSCVARCCWLIGCVLSERYLSLQD